MAHKTALVIIFLILCSASILPIMIAITLYAGLADLVGDLSAFLISTCVGSIILSVVIFAIFSSIRKDVKDNAENQSAKK